MNIQKSEWLKNTVEAQRYSQACELIVALIDEVGARDAKIAELEAKIAESNEDEPSESE